MPNRLYSVTYTITYISNRITFTKHIFVIHRYP